MASAANQNLVQLLNNDYKRKYLGIFVSLGKSNLFLGLFVNTYIKFGFSANVDDSSEESSQSTRSSGAAHVLIDDDVFCKLSFLLLSKVRSTFNFDILYPEIHKLVNKSTKTSHNHLTHSTNYSLIDKV